MKSNKIIIASILSLLSTSAIAAVDQANIVTFSPGSPAKASEVNQTINELLSAINSNAAALIEIQEKAAQVTNSVAGRCYEYQGAEQRLRSIQNVSSGAVDQAFVELIDYDATIAFNADNLSAHFVGEEHFSALIIKGPGNEGEFKEYSDFDSYSEPVGTILQDRFYNWQQVGSVVTITDPATEAGEEDEVFDLNVSRDGSLLTGIAIENEVDNTIAADFKDVKYGVRTITLQEIDCTAR